MARKSLIPAVAYLRKSTAGQNAAGKERQEKSIGQQRLEIENLAKAHGYKINKWYADEGISGWKRGDDRPQFNQMIQEARQRRDVTAVICDDLDRFSRAEVMEVFSDLTSLSAAGVRTLACVNQGEYQLGENDIGRIIKLLVDVHGGNEFSRKLGRRLAMSRRNAAKGGKRSGGMAPFGYKNDGAGGLIVDQDKAPIVVKMFEDFISGARSLLSVASGLNQQGVPGPRGGHWSRETIKHLLTNRVYRGDFVYNRKQSGQFYIVDKNQEVKPAGERQHPNWLKSDEGVFIMEGAHPPLVSAEVFDKVQETLKGRSKTPHLLRTDGYALTGILFCGHCGSPLTGRPVRGKKHYRCGSSNRKGSSVGHSYEVKEDEILPYTLTQIKEHLGVARMAALQPKPLKPFEQVPGRLDQLRRQYEDVTKIISSGRKNLLSTENVEVVKLMQEDMSEAIAEQKRLAAEIEAASMPQDQEAMLAYVRDYIAWIKKHEDMLTKVFVTPKPRKKPGEKMPPGPHHFEAVRVGKTAMTLRSYEIRWDVPTLRQQLAELGARVTLYWEPVQLGKRTVYRLASGKRCRFSMGQVESPLPVHPSGKVMSSSAR